MPMGRTSQHALPNLDQFDLNGVPRRFNGGFTGNPRELNSDNAFRSILPLGVNGIFSITAKDAGIM